MDIIDIIEKKKLGYRLSEEEIKYFVDGYTNGKIETYKMSSLLMAIRINGMDKQETFDLVDAMLNSGDKLDLSELGFTCDKHSTGGVGDKTSLVLVPLLASIGINVSKMSGRGLAHTGGTIDKLESINGIKLEVSNEQFIKQVKDLSLIHI